MIILFLIFGVTFIVFSIVAAWIYIPADTIQEFPFLHILSNISYL